ncbi:CHAT domain-containing protein [Coleofasciculus sp. FACHB-501]|uniref:CHAT domain-containing protein n=1 Tax=Cyanophyceae TaxID=3028117 RepID=UPI001684B7FA|nr:CHAT domain-containing protein [Coleofasciculus sp. FACHB-501]MBD1840112.1 tetratricopeptide repeat protein [Coleofasciculus sp. FACHB-501]
MAKHSKRQLIGWRSLLLLLPISFSASVYRSLALFVTVLLLSSVGAQATSVSIAQQPATSSPNATTTDRQQAYTRAQQLFEQAEQLRQQGTAESWQQALAKYEEALSIWQQLAVNEAPPYEARSWEASTLRGIGTIYYIQNENQKALDSFERGLAVNRELKNRLQEAIARASTDNAGSNSDDQQKLLDSYKQALVATNVGEASLLDSLGNVYYSLGKMQEALKHHNQALSLFQAEKQPSREAITLNNIGDVYFKLGETQSSLGFYNRALVIQRAEKDTAAQVQTLQNIGLSYINLGESQQALESYEQALKIQQERKDLAGQADILSQIGLLNYSLGEHQKALNSYNQALELQQAAQENLSGTGLTFNLSQQAGILSGIASTYASSGFGDYSKALDFYNQARSLLQKAGNRFGEATVLSSVSYVYNQLGEMHKALDALNQALVLWRAIPAPAREAFTLRNIADIHNSMGKPQQALDLYNQALDIQRRVNDRTQEAVTLNSIAGVYKSLGDYQLSIDTNTKALEIFKSIGDRTRQASTLDDIGFVYQEAKVYKKSLDYHNQALTLARENNDFSRQSRILTSIVRAYELLKDYPKALDATKQLLSLSHQQKDSFWEAMSFVMSGRVYLASGDYPKALEATQKAVTGHRKVGTRLAEANALRNLGKVYNALKQYEKALSTYDRELALRRLMGDRAEEAYTLYEVAITQRDKGNLNEARTQIEAAIKIVEDIRTRVTSPELRTSYFASVQNYYQFYIDVLMQLHKKEPSIGYDALALHASERARARSLLELLTEANANIRQGVEPKQLEQERTLQQKLDAVEKRRVELHSSNPAKEQVEKIERERENLLEEYRQAQADIRAKSPRYAALTQPKPLTLAEIQQQVLDDDTLLLEYSLGEERSYLWAVTKTGITSYQLPKRAEIELAARGFYDLLNTPGYRLETRKPIDNQRGIAVELAPANTEVVTKLSQMLLGQVAGKLDKKRLLIVSEGALQYVPFAALPVPTQPSTENNANPSTSPTPLLVNYEIVNLPSASTLAVLRQEQAGRKPAAKAVAVLADPVFGSDDERVNQAKGQTEKPQSIGENLALSALARSARESDVTFKRLPFTRQEAEEILSLVPAAERKQAFDFAANRAFATNPELSQYRIVHFATHGILNSVHPELSGVVLSLLDEKGESQNGFLRLHDVFNLNLPAELVVLSACETGLGEEVKGEGLVGLTRGFMYAGTPRVVVSLWSVSDRATSELMTKFYKGMLEKNLQPAAALRAAQIEMWQKTEWKAPYYWAAFVLQGEWK